MCVCSTRKLVEIRNILMFHATKELIIPKWLKLKRKLYYYFRITLIRDKKAMLTFQEMTEGSVRLVQSNNQVALE